MDKSNEQKKECTTRERKCKTCKETKKITDFDRSYSKGCVSITYRHICSKCLVISRRDYMKSYYKKHYKPIGRPKKYKKKKASMNEEEKEERNNEEEPEERNNEEELQVIIY